MRVLRPGVDPEEFFRRLGAAPARLLLLDYDGTLAPFRVDPADAVPYPGVAPLLDAVMSRGRTQVVVVSGRGAADVGSRLGLRRRPEIWGSHGWEHLVPGKRPTRAAAGRTAVPAPPDTALLLREARALGARVERKPFGVAVHWRGLPPARAARIRREVLSGGAGPRWTWRDFDGGIELRPLGRDKGFVVRTLLREHRGAAAAYLGDDLTDEDAFRAIRGRGLGILVRRRRRATAADLWVRPPEGLVDFLVRWRDAARGSGSERRRVS